MNGGRLTENYEFQAGFTFHNYPFFEPLIIAVYFVKACYEFAVHRSITFRQDSTGTYEKLSEWSQAISITVLGSTKLTIEPRLCGINNDKHYNYVTKNINV